MGTEKLKQSGCWRAWLSSLREQATVAVCGTLEVCSRLISSCESGQIPSRMRVDVLRSRYLAAP